MIAEILGPVTVVAVRMIGAWPGPRSVILRLIIWIFMMYTMVGQVLCMIDYKRWTLSSLMEVLALTITNMLSNLKFAVLWYKQGVIKEFLDLMEEDWKNVRDKKYYELMSRVAKYYRTIYLAMAIAYFSTVIGFSMNYFLRYEKEDEVNYVQRELMLKTTYPFDVYHTPFFEITQALGAVQGSVMAVGNGIADGLLFVLTTHVNGQLDILYDKLLRFSNVGELPDMIRSHQRIIRFAETIDETFKWIALAEFLSLSVVVCAIGYTLLTALESGEGGATVVELLIFMTVMQTGAFVFCHAGNILTEKTLSIRDAAYESGWADMPPETSRMMIVIMMRADKPLSITAGGFCNLNYESWLNISKTAASYLSVIRASSA